MGRATALRYPLAHLPGISPRLAALPHPSGNFSVSPRRAFLRGRYPAQLGRSNSTDAIPDLHPEHRPNPGSVCPRDDRRQRRAVPQPTAFLPQPRGRGGTQLCHALQLAFL